MTFQIPENLHVDCAPIAWLLGTWRGHGDGHYPTIEHFRFGQELTFQQDGRPFFHYLARSWIVDDTGAKVRDAAQETGFLRARPGGRVEWVMAHLTGFAETWHGEAEDGTLEVATDTVARTESAKDYTGGRRTYRNLEGDLVHSYDMAAMGQPLQPHLRAMLQRV
ncbi:FABP family protein [Ruania alba]|uniref:Peroxynitrite isomerase n=1 Tax=Ruania alba TaxID=648782 RepID=A0A1H5DS17_9MICO|nr:FABP family protein [Ruania alba]SED81671.1 protein of unknown function [Ruania alba]